MNSTVKMTSDVNRFDFSLIVIWLIAVLVILAGALWTKHEFKKSLISTANEQSTKKVQQIRTNSDENLVNNDNSDPTSPTNAQIISDQENTKTHNITDDDQNSSSNNNKNLITISIGYATILILLVFVVGMLLLLYFFYNIMSKSNLENLKILISIFNYDEFFKKYILCM